MGIEKRIERLEGRIEPPKDVGAELRRALTIDILDELGRLKGARARDIYRGGNPPTPIQPTDPAGDVLGYPYTRGQVVALAVRRVIERARDEAPDILTREATEELVRAWTEMFRNQPAPLGQYSWDEVECWGPPEPTPPWHQSPGSRRRALETRCGAWRPPNGRGPGPSGAVRTGQERRFCALWADKPSSHNTATRLASKGLRGARQGSSMGA